LQVGPGRDRGRHCRPVFPIRAGHALLLVPAQFRIFVWSRIEANSVLLNELNWRTPSFSNHGHFR
jgi:hypothetical protein